MTILTLDWQDGRPEQLEVGMIVDDKDYGFVLIGDANKWYSPDAGGHMYEPGIKRWAWLVKPHELEWLADIQRKHAKGRPE